MLSKTAAGLRLRRFGSPAPGIIMSFPRAVVQKHHGPASADALTIPYERGIGGATMRQAVIPVIAISLVAAGCQHLDVREGVLSTNQRVAMVSSPGDGVSPPTNLVLYEATPGQFVPISTGYAQAPVTAVISGVGAAATTAFGNYHAARAIRPSVTNVNASSASDSQAQAEGGNSQAQAEGGDAQAQAQGGDASVGELNSTTNNNNQQVTQNNSTEINQSCEVAAGVDGVCAQNSEVDQANDAVQVQ